MKKALVISDNFDLVRHFQLCVEENGLLKCCNIDYRYSSVNKSPLALVGLGLSSINLKDSSVVDGLINKFEVIISLHCKQIFPERLVQSVRCINVHPGLNPHNRGWFPQVFSIINGKPAGVTIHLMDAEVDHGNILYQEQISIFSYDTSESVYKRILEVEKRLLKAHIQDLILGQSVGFIPTDDGNYNSISDFKNLCQLNIDSQGTLRDHINLLRALTHGDYKNAHFIDANGVKVFVKIKLELP